VLKDSAARVSAGGSIAPLLQPTHFMTSAIAGDEAFHASLEKITKASIENHYNVYHRFEWPESLPDDAQWMSSELLSVHGTEVMDRLDEDQLRRLAKWESINFYSLNVHGIRELIAEVTRRIHTPGYEASSEFFHRFIGEENDHMWFFAQFCLKYGPKIYPDVSLKLQGTGDPLAEDFLVFIRIVVFEEIVEYFNVRMGKDQRLHPLVQRINWVHHEDESRHIAGGRQVVKRLHRRLRETASPDLLASLDSYVKRYIATAVSSLYNPRVYADAGLPEPHALRRELLQHPARRKQHREIVKRITDFLVSNQILSEGDFL